MSHDSIAKAQSFSVTPVAHHYLTKPFAMDDLISVIDSIFPPTANHSLVARVLKVVLGGDANVGKTSLIQRYCTGLCDPTRVMTIGVDSTIWQSNRNRCAWWSGIWADRNDLVLRAKPFIAARKR